MLRFLAGAVLLLIASVACADERLDAYLKEGRLTAKLDVLELQGGFAGFTGTYTTVEPDGSWSSGPMLPRDKRGAPTSFGKLGPNGLKKLAAVLAKNDLANLPSAGKPITNPQITTITFGEHTATLMPAAKDPTITARYEAIVAAVKFDDEPKAKDR